MNRRGETFWEWMITIVVIGLIVWGIWAIPKASGYRITTLDPQGHVAQIYVVSYYQLDGGVISFNDGNGRISWSGNYRVESVYPKEHP